MRRFSFFLCLAVLLLSAALASCGKTQDPGAVVRPKANEIKKEYCKGPFCVRLLADRDSMSIAESLVLTIEAEAEDGFEIELPGFGEKLGEFGIADYREDRPQLSSEGRLEAGKTYTLEPFLSGEYTVSPMQVRFKKKGTEEDSKDEEVPEITTEEITIRVNSLLEKDQKELALNPLKGPVALPAEPFSLLNLLLALGAVSCVAGGTFFFLKRRGTARGRHNVPALPAHELALRELNEILDENLLERGELKLFFSRISDVLRSYIENRFGIHAPRRTTEEFLADISRDAPFSREHRELLMEFLRNCDLVKFAEHSPSRGEIEKAIESCKAFIEATKARPIEEGQRNGGNRE